MPYLDWSNSAVSDELRYFKLHLDFQNEGLSEIQIHASLRGFEQLASQLSALIGNESSELRWVLSRETTLFIKNRREGDSKALIAHPEEKEWVATLALSETHFSNFLEKLKNIFAVHTFDIGEIAQFSRTSNLKVKFFLVPHV